MKRFLAVAIITLAAGLNISAQEHTRRPPTSTPSSTPPPINQFDESGWVKFTSEAGHFSVLMPETPTDKAETVQSAHGPYTTHLFIVKDDQSVYLIGWVDYDPAFNFNRQAELDKANTQLASVQSIANSAKVKFDAAEHGVDAVTAKIQKAREKQ